MQQENSRDVVAMIAKVIKLTRADKILWRGILDIHYADYKAFKFSASEMKGERPSFTVNGLTTREYGIGTEELLREIDGQYQRHKMYRYSNEEEKSIREENNERERKQEAENLEKTAKNFLKSPGKNRGKKKRNR